MKIIVSGGAGFIGSHIVDRFIALGHDVAVIDNLSSGKKEFVNPKARLYEVDILDKKSITDIFSKEKPDVLDHHAAQMEVRRSVSDPIFDAQVNILGLINLIEVGRKYGLRQVIFASSGGAIYGDADVLPTPESYPPKPVSPYGVSKLASEFYLEYYFSAYGIKYCALRYGNVYGPRQNPHGEAGVVAIFAQKMLSGRQPVINGDGAQSRDFVFVGDVVEANVHALNHKESLRVNIGTGKGTTVNYMFDMLVSLTGTHFAQIHGDPKPGEQYVSVLDVSLADSKLGWSSSVSLETGFARTVDYFKTHT